MKNSSRRRHSLSTPAKASWDLLFYFLNSLLCSYIPSTRKSRFVSPQPDVLGDCNDCACKIFIRKIWGSALLMGERWKPRNASSTTDSLYYTVDFNSPPPPPPKHTAYFNDFIFAGWYFEMR